MSERLERWKAREKIRSDVGWVAVYTGLGGVGVVVLGLLALLDGDARGLFVGLFVLVLGIALLGCAVGLWDVEAWARWVTLALWSLPLVTAAIERRIELPLFAFALFAVVYLLLPSTGRRFAVARRQITR